VDVPPRARHDSVVLGAVKASRCAEALGEDRFAHHRPARMPADAIAAHHTGGFHLKTYPLLAYPSRPRAPSLPSLSMRKHDASRIPTPRRSPLIAPARCPTQAHNDTRGPSAAFSAA
jgi:hypothetical protein